MTFMSLLAFVRALMQTRTELAAENLALRQQLAVMQRNAKRPRLRKSDRIFWVWFSRLVGDWRSILVIVQPDTVVRWHHRIRLSGRPPVDGGQALRPPRHRRRECQTFDIQTANRRSEVEIRFS